MSQKANSTASNTQVPAVKACVTFERDPFAGTKNGYQVTGQTDPWNQECFLLGTIHKLALSLRPSNPFVQWRGLCHPTKHFHLLFRPLEQIKMIPVVKSIPFENQQGKIDSYSANGSNQHTWRSITSQARERHPSPASANGRSKLSSSREVRIRVPTISGVYLLGEPSPKKRGEMGDLAKEPRSQPNPWTMETQSAGKRRVKVRHAGAPICCWKSGWLLLQAAELQLVPEALEAAALRYASTLSSWERMRTPQKKSADSAPRYFFHFFPLPPQNKKCEQEREHPKKHGCLLPTQEPCARVLLLVACFAPMPQALGKKHVLSFGDGLAIPIAGTAQRASPLVPTKET